MYKGKWSLFLCLQTKQRTPELKFLGLVWSILPKSYWTHFMWKLQFYFQIGQLLGKSLALVLGSWLRKVKVKSLNRVQLCDPMDCSPPDTSVQGIYQAWILEWVAVSFSKGSSQPRDRTQVSRIVGRRFTVWATREAGSFLTHGVCVKHWSCTVLTHSPQWCLQELSNWDTCQYVSSLLMFSHSPESWCQSRPASWGQARVAFSMSPRPEFETVAPAQLFTSR